VTVSVRRELLSSSIMAVIVAACGILYVRFKRAGWL